MNGRINYNLSKPRTQILIGSEAILRDFQYADKQFDFRFSYNNIQMASKHIALIWLVFSLVVLSMSETSEIVEIHDPTFSDLQVQSPRCQLGILAINDTISVKVTVTDDTFTSNSVNVSLRTIRDDQIQNFALTCVGQICQATYIVTDAVKFDAATLTQRFFALLRYGGDWQNNVHQFYLSITKNDLPVCSCSGIFGDQIQRVIYNPQLASSIDFNVSSPGAQASLLRTYASRVGFATDYNVIQVYSFDGGDLSQNLGITRVDPAICAAADHDNVALVSTTRCTNLPLGFYLVRVLKRDSTSGNTFVQITYPNSPYACPFIPSFPDCYRTWPGCTNPTPQDDFPCSIFNPLTGVCSACIAGYILEEGKCFFYKTCEPYHFLHYGECYPGGPNCTLYDNSGKCITCEDLFDNVNDICVRKVPVCLDRQYPLDFICVNISQLCNEYNSTTGACLSCNSGYYGVSNGSCLKKTCISTAEYISAINSFTCVDRPVECESFDQVTQICSFCVFGFYVSGGKCKKIDCKQGQVPSKFQIGCVDVSPLCLTHDQQGKCKSCKPVNYVVNGEGKCIATVNHLAGCGPREQLGFGGCEDVHKNCSSYDATNKICLRCLDNFELNFEGLCKQKVLCGTGYYVVNGMCLRLPSNCLAVNERGFCTQCSSNLLRIVQGQCVAIMRCPAGKYLTDTNDCANINPNCGIHNPSNGQCVTCSDSTVFPVNGVCCPTGQVHNGALGTTSCVDAQTFVDGPGGTCLRTHPITGYCLKCNEGFVADMVRQGQCTPQN